MARLTHGIAALALLGTLAACERMEVLPGQRFDLRTPLEESAAAADGMAVQDARPVSESRPVALPAPLANAEWTHRAGNPAHNVAANLALSAAPQRVWTVALGAGNARRQRIAAAPIVAGGQVFAVDAANVVSAFTTAGAPVWTYDATLPGERGDSVSGGGLAAADGRIYVTTGFGELIALDQRTGGLLWRHRFDAPVAGAPTVAGDTVYVSARGPGGWALSTDGGKVRWWVTGAPSTAGRAGAGAPLVAGDRVVFPLSTGELVAAARKDGARQWVTPVAGERLGRAASFIGDVTGDPVLAGGTIFAGTAAGRTVALDAETGARLWDVNEGALAPVWHAGGSVFLVGDEGDLVRLDAATGARIWSVPLPHYTKDKARRQRDVVAHYGPVMAGGRLVVASADGLVRFFSPVDGAPVGVIEMPAGAAALPAVAGGTLYVVTENGQLHAFR